MLNFVGNPPFTAVSAQPGARRASYFFLCFGFGLGVVLCVLALVVFLVLVLASFLLVFVLFLVSFFLVFGLLSFLLSFCCGVRLSGSVPVPPGFGRSSRFARKVPLRSRANVAGGRWSFPSDISERRMVRPIRPLRYGSSPWNGPHGPRVDISVPCCGPWVWKREPAHIGSAPSRMRYRFSSVRGPVPRDGPGRTCRWPMDRHRCFWMVAAARRVRDWRSASRPGVVG